MSPYFPYFPLAGIVLSGYSTYLDIKKMNAYYNACMAGQN